MIGEIDIDQFALMRSCWSKLKCGTVKGESVPQIPTDLIRAIRQWKVRKVDAIWSLNVWCETKLQLVASELETGKSVTDDVIVHVTKVDGEEEEEEVEEEEERERDFERFVDRQWNLVCSIELTLVSLSISRSSESQTSPPFLGLPSHLLLSYQPNNPERIPKESPNRFQLRARATCYTLPRSGWSENEPRIPERGRGRILQRERERERERIGKEVRLDLNWPSGGFWNRNPRSEAERRGAFLISSVKKKDRRRIAERWQMDGGEQHSIGTPCRVGMGNFDCVWLGWREILGVGSFTSHTTTSDNIRMYQLWLDWSIFTTT